MTILSYAETASSKELLMIVQWMVGRWCSENEAIRRIAWVAERNNFANVWAAYHTGTLDLLLRTVPEAAG